MISLFEAVNCNVNRKIGVIGGGISGLSVAKRLKDLGNSNVVVFDTGKNNVGGRCSTRITKVNDNNIIYDHSSQFMTIHDDSDFKKEIQMFIDSKSIIEWKGSIKRTNDRNEMEEIKDNVNTKRYVGCNGMMTLSDVLSKGLNIRRPCWVSNLYRQPSGKWKLMSYKEDLGNE